MDLLFHQEHYCLLLIFLGHCFKEVFQVMHDFSAFKLYPFIPLLMTLRSHKGVRKVKLHIICLSDSY